MAVHMKNVLVLVTEMFKVENSFSPEMINNVFPITEAFHHCNLRNISNFI